MTVDDVIQMAATRTTDQSGHIGCFVFRTKEATGHIRAQLDKGGGPTPNFWKIGWTVHWRSSQGQEQRDSSSDLKSLLIRFGRLDLEETAAESFDDLC